MQLHMKMASSDTTFKSFTDELRSHYVKHSKLPKGNSDLGKRVAFYQ